MKYSNIIFILFLAGSMVSAQQVVSTSGNSQSVSGFEVSWTVGESVIATIFDDSNTLTQGFHQTNLTIVAVTDLLLPGLEIKVFPNPTQDLITIQFSEYVENSRYLIYDLRGILMENKLIISADTEINMEKFVDGQYVLKLIKDSRQVLQTFKIIKY